MNIEYVLYVSFQDIPLPILFTHLFQAITTFCDFHSPRQPTVHISTDGLCPRFSPVWNESWIYDSLSANFTQQLIVRFTSNSSVLHLTRFKSVQKEPYIYIRRTRPTLPCYPFFLSSSSPSSQLTTSNSKMHGQFVHR